LTDRKVVCVPPETTAREAAQRMAEQHVGSILVAGEDGKMIGIFTERDLMVRVVAAGSDASKVRVADVMTSEVFTTHPERAVLEVRADMRARHIRHIPVIAGDQVLAVLSMRDLIRADLREKRRTVQEMQAYIRGDFP
jgi:signal-transduction protein with cAMP-binding, CBS, and nucleotidyltransferase domain